MCCAARGTCCVDRELGTIGISVMLNVLASVLEVTKTDGLIICTEYWNRRSYSSMVNTNDDNIYVTLLE